MDCQEILQIKEWGLFSVRLAAVESAMHFRIPDFWWVELDWTTESKDRQSRSKCKSKRYSVIFTFNKNYFIQKLITTKLSGK